MIRIYKHKFWLITLAFVFSLFVANSFAEPNKFSSVVPEHKLTFPHDYGAHPDFRLEWWYATGWLETPDGKPLGFQITFFRTATGRNQDNSSRFAAKQLIVGHVPCLIRRLANCCTMKKLRVKALAWLMPKRAIPMCGWMTGI